MTEFAAAPVTPSIAAALEAKTEVANLIRDLKTFQEKIEAKMKTQDDRIAMMDRKSAQRPGLATVAAENAPHRKALDAYLRVGDEAGLRGLSVERKGLTAAVAAEGGYLVDSQTAGRIASILKGAGSLRAVANVVQIEAGSFEVLVNTGDLDTGWIVEGAALAET
ncbi:MAG: phage major capsid protein, partial [Rubrimonas sp.]